MINLERLKKQLVIHEGLELKPYRCSADKLTIGVGRNIQEVGISQDEAMYLLNNDIMNVEIQCRRTFAWYEKLSPVRKECLINLIFNMGLTTFLKFKKTISYIEQAVNGDEKAWELAASELLQSRYARQVGRRAIDCANMLADNLEPQSQTE